MRKVNPRDVIRGIGAVFHPGVGRRFWDKVDIRGDDECWLWQAERTPAGYGTFYINRHNKHPAHRAAYRMVNGRIPHKHFVCHRCDNPPCVNPAHLFTGTQKDNMEDMVVKGRHRKGPPIKGEANKMAKATDDVVRAIRRESVAGAARDALQRKYGLSKATVHRIIRREAWQHVI